MKRLFILNFAILLLFGLFVKLWAYPEFTDTFTSDYISETTSYRSGGNLSMGYPNIYTRNRAWYYKWGDMKYYNGNIYIVWADNRNDGVYTVYLQKYSASDGSRGWTKNVVVGEITNTTYYPTISVYDSSHIYIAFRRNPNDSSTTYAAATLYAARFEDTGTTATNIWYASAIKAGAGWTSDAHPFPYKSTSVVDDSGNFYIHTTWGYIGSGQYPYVQKVDVDGTPQWGTLGNFWNEAGVKGMNKSFTIANEIAFMKDKLYISGEHWMWSPTRDDGSYANKMDCTAGTNEWSTTVLDRDDRGQLANAYRNNALHNDILPDPDNDCIYYSWSDHRSGNLDIFINKLDTDGNHLWAGVRTVATNTGDQEDVQLGLNGISNNILAMYVDYNDSYALKMKLLDKADGSDLGLQNEGNLNDLKPNDTYNLYHPVMVMHSNQIYVAFLTSYDNDQIRLARLDISASGALAAHSWLETNVQDVTYKVSSHTISDKTVFDELVGTVKSARINANYTLNGGSIKFFMSADNDNFYEVSTNITTNFETAHIGADFRVRFEYTGDGAQNVQMADYTVEAVEFFTGNLAYQTNTNNALFGVGTLASSPLVQEISSKVIADGINKNIVYLVLTNQGNSSGNFYFSADGGSGSWDVKYFIQTNGVDIDVTADVSMGDGYYITGVPANGYTNIRVEVIPLTSVMDGEEYDIFIYVTALAGAAVHDAMTVNTIAQKYKPDIAVKSGASFITLGYTELDAATQLLPETNLNSLFGAYCESITNIFVISNVGATNQNVEVSNWAVGTIGNWNVVYSNITKGTSVTLTPSTVYSFINATASTDEIQVIVSPTTSASANETLELGYYVRVFQGVAYSDTLRHDSCKFSYKALKVQPDLILATKSDYSDAIGNNDYTYTNLSVQQEVTQRTVNDVQMSFYVRIQNDGLQNENINVEANKITNSGWTDKYYTNGVEISTTITNSSGIWFNLNTGQYVNIECRYTPDATVLSGDTPDVEMVAYSSNKPYIQDILHIRPRSFRVKPDILVSFVSNSGFISNDVYAADTSDYEGQVLYSRIEHSVSITNYFRVQNDSPSDEDIMYIQAAMENSDWDVSYWTTNAGSWVDITATITNQYQFTNAVGVSRLFRAIITPQLSAAADDIKDFSLKTWSYYVASAVDYAVYSNIAVELKPRLIVNGSDDGSDNTANCSDASVRVLQLAGSTNSYVVNIRNNGGSVEDYRLIITNANIGGLFDDWTFKVLHIDGASTNDRTAVVTNAGWLSSFTAGETKDLVIQVSSVDDAVTDPLSDNGAVSNRFLFDFYLSSETKAIRTDRAELDVMLKRGIPDIELVGVSGTLDQTHAGYETNDAGTYGIILKYPETYLARCYNNFDLGSLDNDDFIIVATVSNITGNFNNWTWRFLDVGDADITAQITNTNTGVAINNLVPGNYETIKFAIVNSNGNVQDDIAVKYELRSKYRQVRKDQEWFYVEIVPGFPEILVSNNTEIRGEGQFSADSYFDEQIELNETNHYAIILSNIAPMHGHPPFILRETPVGGADFVVIYKTNGVIIPRTILQNNGFTNNIYNPDEVAVSPKEILLDVYIVPTNGVVSGDTIQLNYRFSLASNANVYDTFSIDQTVVTPGVDSYFLSGTNYIQLYKKPGESYYNEIRIRNTDSIEGQFITTAGQGTSDISFEYYYLYGSLSNEISTVITNSGWITNITGNQFVRTALSGTVDSGALSGARYTTRVLTKSLKNTNRTDYVDFRIDVVDAVIDMILSNETFVVGQDELLYINGEQSVEDRIEFQETNTYIVRLENDITAGSNANYILSELYNDADDVGYVMEYSIEGTPISLPYSGISLAAGEYTNITLKIRLTNNIASGTTKYLRLDVQEQNVSGDGLQDRISLALLKVNPSVTNYFTDGSSAMTNFVQPGYVVNIPFIVKNNDVVMDTIKITGSAGSADIKVKYLTIQGASTNDISANMLSGTNVLLSAGGSKTLYVQYDVTNDAVSGTSIATTIDVESTKNSTANSLIYSYIEVVFAVPDLWLSNIANTNSVAGINDYSDGQELLDYMIELTNSYILKVENDILAGSAVLFNLTEESCVNMDAYKINYKTNGIAINISSYQLSLAANESKDVEIEVILTNTNLVSGSQGYFMLKQASGLFSDVYDEIRLQTRRMVPDITVQFNNLAGETNLVLWITNEYPTNIAIRYANLDAGNNEKINLMVFPGSNFSMNDSIATGFDYSFTYYDGPISNDISTVITNTNSGWTTPTALENDGLHSIIFTASPHIGAVTGNYVDFTVVARPIDYLNMSNVIHLRINLVNTTIDALINGGNLEVTWDELNEDGFGDDVYLPTNAVAIDRIEENETNTYTLILQNDDTSGDEPMPLRLFPAITGNVTDFDISFFDKDAGTNITIAVINSNFVVSLSHSQSKEITVKVTPNTNNTNSGQYVHFNFYINLTNTPIFEDAVELRVYKALPTPVLKVAGPYDRSWRIESYKDTPRTFYTYKGAPFAFYIAAINGDNVWDDYHLSAKVIVTNDESTNWHYTYTPYDSTNSIPMETTGLYLSNYIAGQYYRVKISIEPEEIASPDVDMDVIFTMKSLKNTNIVAVMTNKVKVNTGYIVGTISDKRNGSAIIGAELKVIDNFGSESSATSDTNGNYVIKVYPLVNSQFEVAVTANKYIGADTNFILETGTNTVNFSLVGINIDEDAGTYARAFPNPTVAGEGATFVYNVENDGSDVRLDIYTLAGKLVRKLLSDKVSKGAQYVVWDGADESGKMLERGVYLFFIKENDKVVVKKIFVQ